MVRHFVRLKTRLLANRLRTESLSGKIGFALIWVAGVGGGVLGGLAVLGLVLLTDEPELILTIAYTATFAGWLVIPAMASALDDTLDPRNFELLPVTSRSLTTGLLIAGVVGPGGIGTLVGLTIATFAAFPALSLAPVVIVAIVVELLMCLMVARLVTTVLSNLLASRRTRELVTLVFGVVFGLMGLIPLMARGEVNISSATFDGFGFLGWLPPGALARSMSLVSEDQIVGGLGLALYAIAATVFIGWAWARSIRRMMVTAPTSGGRGKTQERGDRTLALVPVWLRIPPGPVLGVASKELRYVVRDNRVRSQLLGTIVPAVVVALISGSSLPDDEYAPFLAAAVSAFMVFGVLANQFGADGGSFWRYVVSPALLSRVMLGKNLGWGMLFGVVAVVIAIVMAISSGEFAFLVPAILAAVAVLLVTVPIGNMTSIYGAFRIPERNPFGNKGFSGSVFVAVILSMMATGALLVPLALVVGLPAYFLGPVPATLGAVAAVGYGLLIYYLGMKLTSRLLVERQQGLLDVIDGT